MKEIMHTNAFDVSVVSTPGRLGIIDGRVCMEKPEGLGPWPVIVPGKNVEIYYQNQRVTCPTVIDDVSKLQVLPATEPARSTFEIVVSPDKMEVTLVVTFRKGEKYELIDAPYSRKLIARAKPVRETCPEPIDPALVLDELRELKIKGKVDYEEIMRVCGELKDNEVVIVRGIPPCPPVDGQVELLCEFMSRRISPDDSQRVDFRERMLIASVEPGDVLARWYPPKVGTPGRNVYGEEVVPRRPKNRRFKAGRGVKLVDNGYIAVAQIPGRPLYRKGVLSVKQQIVVPQDVNLATGNIKFTGDVLILGDIAESMTVESGEVVDVKGNVYHAKISAGSHIWVGKKLIGSHLSAGTMHPGMNDAAHTLGRLGKDLYMAAAALSQVKEHRWAQNLYQANEGYLIKCLLEQQFPRVPYLFSQVEELLKSLYTNEELMQDNADLKEQLHNALTYGEHLFGTGVHRLESASQLEQAADCFLELRDRFEALVDNSAEIVVGYCQNSHLEASGNITIRGPLTYNCQVSAGADLTMYGECRSGDYHAQSTIRAHIVGTGRMGSTRLTVGEGGLIKAAVLYPGVQLKIGAMSYEVPTILHNTEFQVQEGSFVNLNAS